MGFALTGQAFLQVYTVRKGLLNFRDGREQASLIHPQAAILGGTHVRILQAGGLGYLGRHEQYAVLRVSHEDIKLDARIQRLIELGRLKAVAVPFNICQQLLLSPDSFVKETCVSPSAPCAYAETFKSMSTASLVGASSRKFL